jgi:protein subunit release factor A
MINWRSNNSVTLTHIPSGESVIVDCTRSSHKNIAIAMKVLRSRLWAQQNWFKRPTPENVVARYNLPDGVEAPNDLNDYNENKL